MNLIEAVKTGELFKRPHWECWQNENDLNVIKKEDLLADDYILKEPKPKIITWYRPTLIWFQGSYINFTENTWYPSKKDMQDTFLSPVVEFETKQLPEKWEI
jgi:hypothetical protein